MSKIDKLGQHSAPSGKILNIYLVTNTTAKDIIQVPFYLAVKLFSYLQYLIFKYIYLHILSPRRPKSVPKT